MNCINIALKPIHRVHARKKIVMNLNFHMWTRRYPENLLFSKGNEKFSIKYLDLVNNLNNEVQCCIHTQAFYEHMMMGHYMKLKPRTMNFTCVFFFANFLISSVVSKNFCSQEETFFNFFENWRNTREWVNVKKMPNLFWSSSCVLNLPNVKNSRKNLKN